MKNSIKSLYIVYIAFLVSCIGTWIAVVFNQTEQPLEPKDSIVYPLVTGVSLVVLALSQLVPMFLQKQIQPDMKRYAKYSKVAMVLLTRWALIEMVTVFNGIIFFIFPNTYSVGFAILGFILYLLYVPNRRMIVEIGMLSALEEDEWFNS